MHFSNDPLISVGFARIKTSGMRCRALAKQPACRTIEEVNSHVRAVDHLTRFIAKIVNKQAGRRNCVS